jgi:hypothetical protein
MVMTGYFDESGTHGEGSPVIIVAGFIASANQWSSYEGDLSQLLAEYGVKVFHARKFRTGKGDFKGWQMPRRAQFNSRFLKLADDHLAYGLATVLRPDDYANIYRLGEFPRRARPDTQYGLCVRTALWKSVVLMKDRREDWPLNVVLEDGHVNAGDAIRVFGEFRDDLHPEYAPLLGKLDFASKLNCMPLAMADSLAYAIFRLTAGYSHHPTEPNAAVVGPADPPYYVRKIPLSRTLIDANTLADLRDGLQQASTIWGLGKPVTHSRTDPSTSDLDNHSEKSTIPDLDPEKRPD